MSEVNEFRVRAVKRYVVTHFHKSESGEIAGSSSIGNFDNLEQAERVGKSLAAAVPGATFTTFEDRRDPARVCACAPEKDDSLGELSRYWRSARRPVDERSISSQG